MSAVIEETSAPLTIHDLIGKRYQSPEWALMLEVAPRTGGGTRYADAVAVNLWQSRGHAVHGFEIKVSRSDWLRELKQPEKAEESVYRYCDFWWIVTPRGIVKNGELPPTWGLIERCGDGLVQSVAAPKLKPEAVTREFFASLMRRSHDGLAAQAERMQRTRIASAEAAIKAQVQREVEQRTRRAQELEECVAKFTEATGLKFDRYSGPPIQVVRLAQRLERLAGWSTSADGSLQELENLAEQLGKAASTIRVALAEANLATAPEIPS